MEYSQSRVLTSNNDLFRTDTSLHPNVCFHYRGWYPIAYLPFIMNYEIIMYHASGVYKGTSSENVTQTPF